jgi:glycosyltransferase involved in cell wall biosynthesis
MKTLCFLWYWGGAEETYPAWRDGLRAALEILGRENDVEIVLGEKIPDGQYDAYLIWGDSNCPAIDLIKNSLAKKGIILTTDPTNIENLKNLDVVFCESTPVKEAVRGQGLHAVKAFATDTDFFTPDPTVKKDIEYFYPATFSPWKRQRDIAYLGDKLWCVGTVQPDGQADLQACKDAGVHIAEGYFKVEHIRDLYRRAKNVIIPAVHGSERTVLEAMSCGIKPIVVHDENVRTRSYIDEYNMWKIDNKGKGVRDFVTNFYTAYQYADTICKNLLL